MADRVDFGKTAEDYATHRAGFPDRLFTCLSPLGIGLPQQQIVDLGTGTGTLARGFAARGCRVIGIDPAKPLLAQARRLAARVELAIEFRCGSAESTGLPDASADVVSAGQCWHWFDRPRAAEECWRILKPDGRIVIAHFDWLPLSGSVVEATEQLVGRFNRPWYERFAGTTGFYPRWLEDLREAGFTERESFSFDCTVPYSHIAWRGRIRACSGVAAALDPEQVEAFDAAHARLLAERFPAEPLQTPHRVFAITARRPG